MVNEIRLYKLLVYKCYAPWQPMYLEMIDTTPRIEFYKGIPSEIDSQHFFDVNKRNLLVLDGPMAQSGRDRRIADLFTKGSHHKNLTGYLCCPENISSRTRNERHQPQYALYCTLQVSSR